MADALTIDPHGGARAVAYALKSLEERYEITASNLANLETAGHKRLVARPELFAVALERARKGDAPKSVRDFSQGDLVETGAKEDLALQGDGFFAVEQNNEIRYMRAVHATIDPDGTITDSHGPRLLAEGGPVRLGDARDAWQVQKDGTVESNGQQLGRLRVVSFVDPQKLEALPGGMFKAPDGVEMVTANSTQVMQFNRERANTDAVREMVELITVHRQYEAAQKALGMESELRGRLNQGLR